jgi:hypothetical protein
MDHGPLHSRVLEMINGADISEPIFEVDPNSWAPIEAV